MENRSGENVGDNGKQARFLQLMERNNAGALSPKGREELVHLVARYEELMLANTETLLAEKHPELFTPSGRLRVKELERAFQRQTSTKRKKVSDQADQD